MKTTTALLTSLLAFASASAFAADLPPRMVTKAPVIVATAYNWTGCYVGAQVGYSRVRDNEGLSSPVFTLDVSNTGSGIIGGGHIGCNYQVDRFVFGIEADLEGSSINQTYTIGAPFANTTGTFRVRFQDSVRGRIGLAWDRVLLYATGGVAFARVENTYCTAVGAGCAFFDSLSSTRTGATVGGGIEYAFDQNWSGRVEYRYTRYRDETLALNNFLAPPGTSADRISENAVRAGISYHFFNGPIVARY